MSRVAVLTGGSPHAHDFRPIGDALVALAADAGHRVERFGQPDDAAHRLVDRTAPPIDVLVVHGLWWRMHGDAYDTWRDEFGYETPTSTRDALSGFIHGGGGLVALHTAPICFDDWPGWGDVLGGSWQWGVSSHPPYGPVEAHVVGDHEIVDDVGPTMRIDDEVYGDLDLRDDITVLATARRSPDDAEQPIVWTHRFGSGRVVVDCLGHDDASIRHPDNSRIVGRAIDWVGERQVAA